MIVPPHRVLEQVWKLNILVMMTTVMIIMVTTVMVVPDTRPPRVFLPSVPPVPPVGIVRRLVDTS